MYCVFVFICTVYEVMKVIQKGKESQHFFTASQMLHCMLRALFLFFISLHSLKTLASLYLL